MNKIDGAKRKRKGRNRSKKREWKRTKFPSTGSFPKSLHYTDEDETFVNGQLSTEKSTFVSQFEQVLNISPSKSENDSLFVASDSDSDIVQSSDNEPVETQGSIIPIREPFTAFNEVSSDEDRSFLYDSITEEFKCDRVNGSKTEIVSADVSLIIETKPRRKNEEKSKKPSHNSSQPLNNLLIHDVQCSYTNDGVVAVLQKNETVYLHGVCQLVVLHGQVEILGHTVTKNTPEVKLYSPRGSSLMYLKNITETNVPAVNYFSNLNMELTEKCAVILCKMLEDPKIEFIEKHISQQILPTQYPNFPRIVFQPKEGNFNLLKIGEKWPEIVDRVTENTRLMTCGGKGVGKTTFLRYAINKLLMRFPKVRIIDLDPGQSEFTIPGCLSIVEVDKPVFGVNYTHLRRPQRSILSNINIAYEPDRYIASVRELLDTNLSQVPTLVNYMGYTHGIGINILSAVIACVGPTDLVQICSRDQKKNYKVLLNMDVVRENAQIFLSLEPQLNYNWCQIESVCDGQDGWAAEPRQLREMVVLSYISEMIGSTSIFNSQAPMYRINLDDIVISNLNKETIHPASVNACLISLCREKEKVFECLGWGIVRGVDLTTNELVLITSEEISTLDQVTHLVANGATLPPSMYMTPDDVSGAVPYVVEGQLTSLGQIPKRSHVAVK